MAFSPTHPPQRDSFYDSCWFGDVFEKSYSCIGGASNPLFEMRSDWYEMAASISQSRVLHNLPFEPTKSDRAFISSVLTGVSSDNRPEFWYLLHFIACILLFFAFCCSCCWCWRFLLFVVHSHYHSDIISSSFVYECVYVYFELGFAPNLKVSLVLS